MQIEAMCARTSILVVDDDPAFRSIVQEALEDDGLMVDAASDGQQAMALATARPPALVVLDWGMPLADGGMVASQLRGFLGDELPVLLITADGRAAQKARQANAYAYLHKPLDVDTLVATVRRGLARS